MTGLFYSLSDIKTILTTSYHIFIKMFPKSLISELSRAIAGG